MTINVDGVCSAPVGVELEVIQAHAGVEQNRFRVRDGDTVSLCVHGSTTLILREVSSASELEPKPGDLRHGELDPIEESAEADGR